MDFFRKVKNFVTGQAEAPTTSGSSADSASEGSKAPRSQAAVAYRQPVLQNAGFGAAGGVQGLDWYTAKLKQDRDGDVADEFLLERTDQDTKGAHTGLQAQKRHLKQPKDTSVLVEDGNVYVVPKV
ncbi:hypothetical protein WJX79_001491 [Trebouxia sp. C0005]